MSNKKIAIFTGGTGGHVIPSINFGNYLINLGYNCVIFLDSRGLKYASEFQGNIIIIKSAHFSGNFFFKITSLFQLIIGCMQSLFYLFKFRPAHCISFGSYASFMPLLAANILKFLSLTKIHLHEQNSMIGKVNLFFIPFANNIFVNFNNLKNLKTQYKKKTHLVGLPLRDTKQFQKRNSKIHQSKKIKILVYGGSQGSINLNFGFVEMIKNLPLDYLERFEVLMQCPKSQQNQIKDELKKLEVNVKIKIFFQNIDNILISSDIVLARSGAGTINDIIFFQIPSILVPLPHSINNHQLFNAKYLIDKNAAELIEEKIINSKKASLVLKRLIDSIELRETMIKNLQSFKILDANKLMIEKIFI